MDQDVSFREKGSFLYGIDQHFNPAFRTKGIKRNNVLFIYGPKIDKTFYYNHRHPTLSLPRVIKEHFDGFFDIIAHFGPDLSQDGQLALKLLKGLDEYLEVTGQRAHTRGSSNVKGASPRATFGQQRSIRPGMDQMRGELRAAFDTAIQNAQENADPRESYHVGAPARMIHEFGTRVFETREYRAMLILDAFTDWVAQLLQGNDQTTFARIKQWCNVPELLNSGHAVVFLMKDDFFSEPPETALGMQGERSPLMKFLNRELASQGNVIPIQLKGHTRLEVEKYLAITSLGQQLPFSIQEIPQVAEILASAGNLTGRNASNNQQAFRSGSFDIDELAIELKYPETWPTYFAAARKLVGVRDYPDRLATQIYHPQVIERMLDWLMGAVETLFDNQSKLPVIMRNAFLYGPFGTGKTSFAKAIVGEFGFSMLDEKFTSRYVGGSADIISETFNNAREIFDQRRKPVLVFQDEMGRLQPSDQHNAHDQMTRESVEQFKQELDSTRSNRGVYCVAGSNEPIHPELSERFTPILVPLPGPTEIYRQLVNQLGFQNLDPSIDPVQMAHEWHSNHFSQRIVKTLCAELNMFQRRSNVERLNRKDIQNRVEKFQKESPSYEKYKIKTAEEFPDIEYFRNPDEDERQIAAMVEDTRAYIVKALAALE